MKRKEAEIFYKENIKTFKKYCPNMSKSDVIKHLMLKSRWISGSFVALKNFEAKLKKYYYELQKKEKAALL